MRLPETARLLRNSRRWICMLDIRPRSQPARSIYIGVQLNVYCASNIHLLRYFPDGIRSDSVIERGITAAQATFLERDPVPG